MRPDSEKAYWLERDELVSDAPEAFFSFLGERGHVVSLVGGGGKSTLMNYMASCCAAKGLRAAAMTTTRIQRPENPCLTFQDCCRSWAAGKYAACGRDTEEGKFRQPDDELLHALLKNADAVVIEADGAKRMACKAPSDKEPVILPESDIVVGVMGLEVLGKRVGDVCFRLEQVCALLGCDEDHLLTEEDMTTILLHEAGTKKSVGSRAYYIVLNKCDDALRLEAGKRILLELRKKGHERAALMYFPPKRRAES